MRYDQSMRALKYLLDAGLLGESVLATIEMRAIPHWQTFLEQYDKLELFGMSRSPTASTRRATTSSKTAFLKTPSAPSWATAH